MGLVVAVFTVSFFGDWPPLTPLMVLWINLVTNGAPRARAGDRSSRPTADGGAAPAPRRVAHGLSDYAGIVYVGTVMGLAAVAIYALAPDGELAPARALAFSLLALSPLMHAFSCRSPLQSILGSRPLVSWPLVVAVAVSAVIHLVAVLVPTLQPVFKTFPVSTAEWLLVLGLAVLVVPAVEAAKLINRKRMAIRSRGR